ncbi:succinyldiaminopimelate transaminase [Pseudoglutamicibacter albus]|uniref:succinyldiaminopimelate transaminase n=1 Tax=Pseudoglutamicibacter albus TaxID=98671 RepID=UPI000C7808C0|nr:succinyldiaminopimelate transaminase [Pseudoglutamicibacter albus]PKY79882.1 succinyldiaminopimelate transaminase [Pseudoglutamicibacter albus]WIK84004.1 succinyldiaminopimelate transaminase [Pseudoglutamicibacter albus]
MSTTYRSSTQPTTGFGLHLPDYPWELLAPYRERAQAHPDGAVDVSIGTPVDPTPKILQDALAAATDSPGYPTTQGTAELREAIAQWWRRRRNAADVTADMVMPVVGSKEFIAWLPLILGLGGNGANGAAGGQGGADGTGNADVVVCPRIAYPTYAVGATLAGAEAVSADSLDELDDETRSRVKLVYLNSPGNPTGSVLTREDLARWVRDAREIGAVIASDECYAELGWGEWEDSVPSVLDTEVNGGDLTGLLGIYSMSKQSNLAGYRAAFVTGAPELMPDLINTRKHAGMMIPGPVQHAMTVGLADDEHVAQQKNLYRARREQLKSALESAGFTIDHSEAGLYLWATRGEDCWDTIGWLADRGIIAGPGAFYGPHGTEHVRIALTASDERIQAAVERLK